MHPLCEGMDIITDLFTLSNSSKLSLSVSMSFGLSWKPTVQFDNGD